MDYILKSALISATLFAFYKAFLEKETFFYSNRLFFLLGILVSVLLPLIIIPVKVEVMPSAVATLSDATSLLISNSEKVPTEVAENFDWQFLLYSVYGIGFLFFTFKFLFEIGSLAFLLYKNPKRREGNYVFVETKQESSPFSFFFWIVFNRNRFTKEELKLIINHEKVHVNEWHSIDLLFIQILLIFQWFNPFLWLYKKELQQNLEYIADNKLQQKISKKAEKESNLKDYQYLLLKTSIGKDPFALTNNFFNSHLKKRIIMLQKSKTNRFNQIKFALLLPLLALFMYSFSTKEVLVVKRTNQDSAETPKALHKKEDSVSFIFPINEKDLTRMASGFGMRTHPVLKIRRMHLGMDFSAKKGANVYASANGIVLKVNEESENGKIIEIKHEDGFQTNYYHLNKIFVKKGAKVNMGDIIGEVGNTGVSVAPHLHFEMLKDGKHINPIQVLPFGNASKKKSTHNTKKYLVKTEKVFKKTIGKNTTQAGLAKIKKYFKKVGVNVQFSNIQRNDKGEIFKIGIIAKSKNSQANFNANRTNPITKITIEYNKKDDSVDVSTSGVNIKRNTNTSYSNSSTSFSILKTDDEDDSIEILETDENTNTTTSYLIAEKEDNNTNKKSVKITTSSQNGAENVYNYKEEIIINTDQETGKTDFVINGKKYTEEEISKLKEIGVKGFESIERIQLDQNRIKNHEGRIEAFEERTKALKKRMEGYEERLKQQQKRLKNQEARLKEREKQLKKREKELKKRANVSKEESGFINYSGVDYYYAGNDFYDRFGTPVSKKLAKELATKKQTNEKIQSENATKSTTKETGYILYEKETYYYVGNDFYDRYGNKVDKKLAKKLRKQKA